MLSPEPNALEVLPGMTSVASCCGWATTSLDILTGEAGCWLTSCEAGYNCCWLTGVQGKPLVWLAVTLCYVLVPTRLTTACDRTEASLEGC